MSVLSWPVRAWSIPLSLSIAAPNYGRSTLGKKLFVRNIATSVDSWMLEDLFNSVGDVERAEIDAERISPNGLRVGYVYMQTEQGALDCIDRFNGFEKNGYSLIVTEDAPHKPDPNFLAQKRRKAIAKKKDLLCKTAKTAART